MHERSIYVSACVCALKKCHRKCAKVESSYWIVKNCPQSKRQSCGKRNDVYEKKVKKNHKTLTPLWL